MRDAVYLGKGRKLRCVARAMNAMEKEGRPISIDEWRTDPSYRLPQVRLCRWLHRREYHLPHGGVQRCEALCRSVLR